MRSTTGTQDSALASLDRKEVLRVSIEDASATMVHYTRIGGGVADWVRSWQVTRGVDAPAGSFTVSFLRDLIIARYAATVTDTGDLFTAASHGLANGDNVHVEGATLPGGLAAGTLYFVVGVSGATFQLSATSGGSAVAITADGSCSVVHVVNIAPTAASANAVEVGRDILIECAVVSNATADADIAAGEWQELLAGRIDRANWPEQLTVSGRDGFGVLQDSWIETPGTYATGGEAQETTMQTLVDDAPGVALTLYVPSPTGFTIVQYEQRIQSAADALIAHQNLIGWDLHEEWDDGTGAWRITYAEPPRTKTTPDFTIDSDQYFVVGDIGKDTDSVRNVGVIEWRAGSFVVVEDTDSIAEFGRRPIFFDARNDPQITTSGLATTLVTAAITDLGQPLVAIVIEGPLFWPVQLSDLITFGADVVHLEAAKDLAVVGFTHSGGPQGNTTTFQLRGKPSGGTLRWHRFARPTKNAQEIAAITGGVTTVPTEEVKVSQSGSVGTLELVLNDPDDLITATAFETHEGAGDYDFDDDPANWSLFDDSSPYTLTETVALAEGHNSVIGWAYRFAIGGSTFWKRGHEPFDADVIPDVEIQGVSRNAAGEVQVSLKGDEDTADIYVTWTIGDGTSEPADPIATDDALGGRSGTLDTATTAEPGEVVWVKARGVDAGATLAPVANIAEAKHEVAGVPDGSVDQDSFAAGIKILADQIVSQAAGFSTDINIREHGSNADLIQWDTGSVWYADGSEVAVTGGTHNPGDIVTGVNFVYFDGADVQSTNDYTVAIGDPDFIVLATIDRATAASFWVVIPAIGVLGVTGAPIQTRHLTASLITADKIAANAVTATKISVTTLSAIVADVGTLTAGVLQNAAGTRFIDLDASGSDPFIQHDNFELLADGTATFSGDLSAASGTFSGTVASSSFTASTATFSGLIFAGAGAVEMGDAVVGGGYISILNNAGTSTFGGLQAYGTGGPGSADTLRLFAHTAATAGLLIDADDIGFFGATPISQPDVTGSRGGNAALASLLTALEDLGLITDSST
jgi:hypothetical protein